MPDNKKIIIEKLQSNSFRGIIFDFDGTLLDISAPLERSIEEVFTEKKIPYEKEKTLQEIGSTIESVQGYPITQIILQSHDLFKQLTIFPNLSFLKKMRIAVKIFSRYLEYSKEAQLFSGVNDLLNYFNKQAKLFIVSHNQTKSILEILRREKKEYFFEDIYGADLLPALKPHPDAFLPILEKYSKIKQQDWLLLGDMPTDIEAGKEAGLYTIGIASGISKREVLAQFNPDLLTESISDLLKIIGIKNNRISNSNSNSKLKINS